MQEDVVKENQAQYCKLCGKKTVSLHKGVCFACRENSGSEDEKARGVADIDLHLEWIENKSRRYGRMGSLLWRLISKPMAKYGWAVWWFYIAFLFLLTGLSDAVYSGDGIIIVYSLMFTISLLVAGIFNVVYIRKRRIKKFYKYCNSTVVFTEDYGWKCPCCKTYNLGTTRCDVCGVLPQLTQE